MRVAVSWFAGNKNKKMQNTFIYTKFIINYLEPAIKLLRGGGYVSSPSLNCFHEKQKSSDFAIFDMKNRHFFKFYQDSSTNENSVNRLFRKPNYIILTLRGQIIVHNVSFI